MIYDILIKNEALEVFWLILASVLGLFYYLFLLKFRKRVAKQKINIFSLFIVVWVIGFIFNYFGAVSKNQELNTLKLQYRDNQYQSVQGVIYRSVYKNDGIDSFTIDGISFLRVDPHKQVPKSGCWNKFIAKQVGLDGKLVKMDFITFPKHVSLSLDTIEEKLDQICILKLEKNEKLS